jgi:hypothetical protein
MQFQVITFFLFGYQYSERDYTRSHSGRQ